MSSAPKNSKDHGKESVSDTMDIELSNEELEVISAAGNSTPKPLGQTLLEQMGELPEQGAGNGLLPDSGDGAMSTQERMRLQAEMTQQNQQNEMITNVGNKTSENAQTLFKNQ